MSHPVIDPRAVDVLSSAECEAIAKRVLGFARADETTVEIRSTSRANTRFALNQVSASGEDTNTTITVSSTFGKRGASVSTNKLDDASLAAAVQHAEELARLSPENPEFMPVLGPQMYRRVIVASRVMPDAHARAMAVKAVTDRARVAGFVASGYLETNASASATANSRGLFAYEREDGANLTATVRTPDGTGSGWAGANAEAWSGIDAERIGAQATEKAGRSRNPIAAEPGRYTVVLEPTAVGNLVPILSYAMNARTADEGRSFYSKQGGGNKIGTKVVDERVTLVSDPADASGVVVGENGYPVQRVVWIERGVVTNLRYGRFWAAKMGRQPTAAPPGVCRMSGGGTSLAEMIASTGRGVLVTRFWYIRGVDPHTLLYTGLTRDGTFLIEDGKVTRAIKNFRFNESPVFMLNNLDAMGTPVRVSASENGSPNGAIIVPPIKCHDFNFTSLSDAV